MKRFLVPFLEIKISINLISFNFELYSDNGFTSPEKPGRSLPSMQRESTKIEGNGYFQVWVSKKKMEGLLSRKIPNICWKGPWGNSPSIFWPFLPEGRNVVPATWVTHYDDNCSVCTCTAEIKKGGRPKKVRRGRKPDLAGPSNALLNPPQDL